MRLFALAVLMAAFAVTLDPHATWAAEPPASLMPIKFGVMTDMSSRNADILGQGSVLAARMAVEDFGGKVLGRPIEIVSADHQNKADIGAGIARQWFDVGNVGMAIDFGHSAVALAVQEVARAKKKITIYTAVGTTELTNKACSPYGIAWTYDAHALSAAPAQSLVAQSLDSWFFLTVDYAFGYSMQAEASEAVLKAGGKVVGAVRHPQEIGDFSAFLIQAQSSGAKVVSMIESGTDLVTEVKQAREFGLQQSGQTIVVPLVFITDVNGMGLDAAQGLTFVTAFYWDRDEDSRKFARRFFAERKLMPSMAHASVYSGVSHYLKSIAAAGTDEPDAVMAKMREIPVDDFYARGAHIREDGRLMHDLYLAQVKTPAESTQPWDYYKILATIPAEQAFRPLSASECPLIRR